MIFREDLSELGRISNRGVVMKSRLNELIEKSGLRKKYIAKEVGITPTQFSNWIAGRSYPPLDKAYKLAKLLNCKVDDLYEEEEESNGNREE